MKKKKSAAQSVSVLVPKEHVSYLKKMAARIGIDVPDPVEFMAKLLLGMMWPMLAGFRKNPGATAAIMHAAAGTTAAVSADVGKVKERCDEDWIVVNPLVYDKAWLRAVVRSRVTNTIASAFEGGKLDLIGSSDLLKEAERIIAACEDPPVVTPVPEAGRSEKTFPSADKAPSE